MCKSKKICPLLRNPAPQKHCFGSGSFYLVSFLLNLIEGHHFDLLKNYMAKNIKNRRFIVGILYFILLKICIKFCYGT